MAPRIIGLCGAAGAGKSTAAQFLEIRGYVRLPFAAPLKAMLRYGLGLTDAQVNGNLKETPSAILGGKTPRHAMQTLGTEWGRNLISPDLWVSAWARMAEEHPLIVADDVRFANELLTIVKLGGIVIRVERFGAERTAAHESEAYHNKLDVDYSIMNVEGDTQYLRREIAGILKKESANNVASASGNVGA